MCFASAEVVLFTAGLEDYAKPITDALDHCHKACFQDRRLFRPATVACDLYPCIKDLSRLGRDMRRTVLIDDTPLAFLMQPNNGIPIYGFRWSPTIWRVTDACAFGICLCFGFVSLRSFSVGQTCVRLCPAAMPHGFSESSSMALCLCVLFLWGNLAPAVLSTS